MNAVTQPSWHLAKAVRITFLLATFQTAAMVYLSVSALGYGDFPQLHDSAQAYLNGRGLYSGPPTLQGTNNLNPPHLALLMSPLGALSLPAAAAVMWLAILGAAALFASAATRAFQRPASAMVLAFVLASAANSIAVSLINVAWLLAAATAWAWIWQREGRTRRAALTIGCLAAFKVFFLIFLPYWLWRRQWRSVAWCIASMVAIFAAGVLLAGWHSYGDWIAALQHGSPLTSDRPLDASWHSVVTRLPLTTSAARVLWLAGSALVAGASGWYLRRPRDVDAEWAVILTAMLVLSPLGWMYYALIPALPLAAVLIARPPTMWVRMVIAGALLPPAAIILFADSLPGIVLPAVVNSTYALTLVAAWLTLMIGGRIPRPPLTV